MASLYYIIYYL